jgi:preprotein translocase subunit SecB
MNKVLNVQATLLRNASLQDHNMTKCLFTPTQLTFEIGLNQSNEIILEKDGIFNVNVDLTIKAFENLGENGEQIKGEAVYTATVQQSGIFLIQGFTATELEAVLAVNCPSIVFPYARAEINRMLSETQMQKPPLQPVQFDSIFYQKKEKEKAEAEAAASESTTEEEKIEPTI